jgi:hypothetical protein
MMTTQAHPLWKARRVARSARTVGARYWPAAAAERSWASA